MVFTRADIISHLTALSDELEKQGIRGEIFLVGGAAMALAYNRKRTTKDLDAVFEPKTIIYDLAETIARKRSLKPGWLNDAVKGFLPGPDAEARTLLDLPGLSITVASPRYLFALKALASREDRDIDDIKELYRLCKFSSVDEAIHYVDEVFRGRPIAARVGFVLRETLEYDSSSPQPEVDVSQPGKSAKLRPKGLR